MNFYFLDRVPTDRGHEFPQYPQLFCPVICSLVLGLIFVEHQCLPSGSSWVMQPSLNVPLYFHLGAQGVFGTGLPSIVRHGQSLKLHWRVLDPLHCCPPFLADIWILRVSCPAPQVLLQELQLDHLQFTLLFVCPPRLLLFWPPLLGLHFRWSLHPSLLQNGLTHRLLCLLPTFLKTHLHRSFAPGLIFMSCNVP